MTAGELSRRIGGTLIAANADNEISRGMVCDMLSHAMAHGKAGCAWVTVQTHMTAVAIAAQCSMACIIWPDGIAADMLSAQRAGRHSNNMQPAFGLRNSGHNARSRNTGLNEPLHIVQKIVAGYFADIAFAKACFL